jgi:hypothetical protein
VFYNDLVSCVIVKGSMRKAWGVRTAIGKILVKLLYLKTSSCILTWSTWKYKDAPLRVEVLPCMGVFTTVTLVSHWCVVGSLIYFFMGCFKH